MYNLNIPFNFRKVLEEPESEETRELLKREGIVRHSYTTSGGHTYRIYKYDRKKLEGELYSTRGMFRSVVTSGDRLVCFSPPKSIGWEEAYDEMERDEVTINEFVEGVMVNVFYDEMAEGGTEGDGSKGGYVYCTKSSIYGKGTFFDNGIYPVRTFGELFLEVCESVGLKLDSLDKTLCYSFVMQHPSYRIVKPISKASLTLVAMYKVDTEKLCVCNVRTSDYIEELGAGVRLPTKYTLEDELTYDTVYRMVCELSSNGGYGKLSQGLMLTYYNQDGECKRTKVRDTRHQQIHQLRGNEPKLEYHYLILRGQNRVKEYLEYYPEHRAKFMEYRKKVTDFTMRLHQLYRDIFILKKGEGVSGGGKLLGGAPYQYRTRLYDLHSHYINVLRPKGEGVTFEHVKNYVNGMIPAKLMFSLNYDRRNSKGECKTSTCTSNGDGGEQQAAEGIGISESSTE